MTFEMCVTCPRNGREAGIKKQVLADGQVSILQHALEVTAFDDAKADEISGMTPEVGGRIWEASGDEKTYFGATIICGRRIGKGACSLWMLDSDHHITGKVPQE